MNERPEDNDMIKAAWRAQALEAPRISLELVRHHVDKLNADLREQNLLMYFAIAVLVCALPFGHLRNASMVLWIGSLLALIGAAYVVLEMRRRTRTLEDTGADITQTLDAYRAELERRRDYYLYSWRWSIWPMIPSVVVLMIGGLAFGTRPNAVRHTLWMGVFMVAATGFAIWDHRRKGHAYQRELDAFESLRR